jgi:hypothetical protein
MSAGSLDATLYVSNSLRSIFMGVLELRADSIAVGVLEYLIISAGPLLLRIDWSGV